MLTTEILERKITIKDLERQKEEGNRAFAMHNYPKAIKLYEEGLRLAQTFAK